jgi:hypothetical protein
MRSGNVLLVAGSANFSTRDVWDGYRVALGQAGLNVIPYSTFSFLKLLSVDAVCNDIIGTALDEANRIDYAIFIDGLYFRGHRSRVPQSIRRAGVPTVLIATDDPYDTIPNTESLYTFRFTNEQDCASDGVEYLPTATLVPPEIPLLDNPTYDVSFLGTVFEDRSPTLVRIAEYCEQKKLRMLIAGKLLGDATLFDRFRLTDVRVKTVDQAEKWQIYADSRVTLNLFRQSESVASSPSPRIFEVTAYGHAALISGPQRKEVDAIYGDSIYHCDDADSVIAMIEQALADPESRRQRIEQAKQITLAGQTYHHRAEQLIRRISTAAHESSTVESVESKTAWVIGCGRTGSTWLAEMLGDLPKIRRWHEPYFGRLFRHLQERPDELDRNGAFFSRRQQPVWSQGLRELFFRVARDRFPRLDDHGLVVKEVNTPEIYRWIHEIFPTSRLILLARDPFDVLDSYLDLQRPGSWNERFGSPDIDPLDADNVGRTADHIRKTMNIAIDAYDAFPPSQRLWLSYERLLEQTAESLLECAQLIGVSVRQESVEEVVQKHRFENYKQTGPLEFRRQGKAGGWSESTNFTDQVRQIADETLGDLRIRLGYRAEVNR